MNDFYSLRIMAREKRDRIIAHARTEYEATLHEIAVLEVKILGKRHLPDMKTGACVNRVIPDNKEFTLHDVMNGLEAIDPTRAWSKKAVANQLLKLRKSGVIQRTKRSTTGCAAVYIRPTTPREKRPFEDMPLVDVVASVLSDRSMTVLELAVAVLEAGFKTSMRKKRLTDAIYAAMLNSPERFKRAGNRWSSSITYLK